MCDLRCARKRTEKRLRKTIRTLRKAINKEQFHVRLSGIDHEVVRKSVKLSDPPEFCSLGQVRVENRCGTCCEETSITLRHAPFVLSAWWRSCVLDELYGRVTNSQKQGLTEEHCTNLNDCGTSSTTIMQPVRHFWSTKV